MQQHNSRGFTLIEMAIVLTIVGIIIGGLWVGVASIIHNNKIRQLSTDIMQVIQNTKTLFAGQGAAAITDGFTAADAVVAGVVPIDMISASSTPTNPVVITPFSTDTTINTLVATPWGLVAGGHGTGIAYQFGNGTQGLPADACIYILTTLGGIDTMQRLNITRISGGDVNHFGVDITNLGTTAITPAMAAGVCSYPGNVNYVQITFNVI